MGSQPPDPNLEPDLRRVLDALRWIFHELRAGADAGRSGLSVAQTFVLHLLLEHGPLSVGELARLTATDPSSVSVVVRKLHEKALVAKQADPSDRRRLRVSLTASGSRMARRLGTPVQELLMRRLAGLGPKRLASLAGLLEQVAPAEPGEGGAPMFGH